MGAGFLAQFEAPWVGDGASAGFVPEQQGTGQAGREGAPKGLESEDAAESEVLPPAVGKEPLGCSGPLQAARQAGP